MKSSSLAAPEVVKMNKLRTGVVPCWLSFFSIEIQMSLGRKFSSWLYSVSVNNLSFRTANTYCIDKWLLCEQSVRSWHNGDEFQIVKLIFSLKAGCNKFPLATNDSAINKTRYYARHRINLRSHLAFKTNTQHYNDVIMSAMASQITSLTIVSPTVYSGSDQTKHQSSASLAFVRGIHRWPVNSPHKGPVTRKRFPLDYVITISL